MPSLPRYYRFSKPILVSLDHWARMDLIINSYLKSIIVDTVAFKEILTNNYKLQDLFELSIRTLFCEACSLPGNTFFKKKMLRLLFNSISFGIWDLTGYYPVPNIFNQALHALKMIWKKCFRSCQNMKKYSAPVSLS